MLYVLLANGTYDEIPEAVLGVVEEDEFVCLDAQGEVARRFAKLEVSAYGRNPAFQKAADSVSTRYSRTNHSAAKKLPLGAALAGFDPRNPAA